MPQELTRRHRFPGVWENKKGGLKRPPFRLRFRAASVSGEDRPLRRLSRQVLERLRQVLPVVQEEDTAGPLLHQERHQRGVRLGRVAVAAGEDQIVRTIVGRLAPTGTNVVQGDDVGLGLRTAVGAHRAVLGQEPIAVSLKRTTRGTAKAWNRDCGASA
jgi:hypothetical protein